jgi:glutathione S-transferase
VQPWVLRLSKPLVRRALEIKKDTATTAPARIREIFDEVAGYLERHPHLTGDQITAADLSFAAMAAPGLMPEEGHPTDYPDLSELTPPVAEAMRGLREHPAGQYALRMYREER